MEPEGLSTASEGMNPQWHHTTWALACQLQPATQLADSITIVYPVHTTWQVRQETESFLKG